MIKKIVALENFKIGLDKNESGGIDILIEFKFEDHDKEDSCFGKFQNWT